MSTRQDAALVAAHAEVKAELARTDTKASLLLAFNGALLAGSASLAASTRPPLPAALAGAAGAVLLVVAAGLLLVTVRPNLNGGGGFPKWATLTPAQLRAHLGQDRTAEDIRALSRIAVGKFALLRQAIHLTCAAGFLLSLAATMTLGGAA